MGVAWELASKAWKLHWSERWIRRTRRSKEKKGRRRKRDKKRGECRRKAREHLLPVRSVFTNDAILPSRKISVLITNLRMIINLEK